MRLAADASTHTVTNPPITIITELSAIVVP